MEVATAAEKEAETAAGWAVVTAAGLAATAVGRAARWAAGWMMGSEAGWAAAPPAGWAAAAMVMEAVATPAACTTRRRGRCHPAGCVKATRHCEPQMPHRAALRCTHLLSQKRPWQHLSSLTQSVSSWLQGSLPPNDCAQPLVNVFCGRHRRGASVMRMRRRCDARAHRLHGGVARSAAARNGSHCRVARAARNGGAACGGFALRGACVRRSAAGVHAQGGLTPARCRRRAGQQRERRRSACASRQEPCKQRPAITERGPRGNASAQSVQGRAHRALAGACVRQAGSAVRHKAEPHTTGCAAMRAARRDAAPGNARRSRA